ncbi:hypothetical protein B0A55_10814 [Friedmanniomyces simplex]|uniref:Uncharacterized protein n=1 Tax=Friedmanniomyces simplex TaxID=329884 RepID=A0A4U0WE27_9PEZI|nr:hypothetical protein B0A55_10814 [Friedmanniomyces simplex]
MATSLTSLTPCVLSMIFIGVWIGVSVGKYNADVQVATQTAFTGGVLIIFAGALFVALLAFLETRLPEYQ